MADQSTKIRDVAWSEVLPWLILLRSVRISLLARVLILGAVGLVAMTLGWQLLGKVFANSTDPVVEDWRENTSLGIWEDSIHKGMPNPWVNTTARSAGEVFVSAADWSLFRGPISIWLYLTRPFFQMFQAELTATGFLFLLLCGLWELLVWGLFGGAITRIAALKFTRDEAPGIVAALKHAATKLPSYSLPALIALAGTAVFALQLVLLGFIMRIDALAFLAALAWPFVILLGLMMAVLLLGALAGWPLMWATVSVEGTDAFDALSRSYAYTYHRPWRLLWYVLFAGFLAVVSMFVVKLFASSAVTLGNWSIHWSLDKATMRTIVAPLPSNAVVNPATPAMEVVPPITFSTPVIDATAVPEPPSELTGIRYATQTVIRFWKSLVAALVAGYQAGFLWVSAVGIYLLLRHDIDGVQMNEVYIDEAEEYGMPPLADDPATGLPDVSSQVALPGDTGG